MPAAATATAVASQSRVQLSQTHALPTSAADMFSLVRACGVQVVEHAALAGNADVRNHHRDAAAFVRSARPASGLIVTCLRGARRAVATTALSRRRPAICRAVRRERGDARVIGAAQGAGVDGMFRAAGDAAAEFRTDGATHLR